MVSFWSYKIDVHGIGKVPKAFFIREIYSAQKGISKQEKGEKNGINFWSK